MGGNKNKTKFRADRHIVGSTGHTSMGVRQGGHQHNVQQLQKQLLAMQKRLDTAQPSQRLQQQQQQQRGANTTFSSRSPDGGASAATGKPAPWHQQQGDSSSWTCPNCSYADNWHWRTSCFQCTAPRPGGSGTGSGTTEPAKSAAEKAAENEQKRKQQEAWDKHNRLVQQEAALRKWGGSPEVLGKVQQEKVEARDGLYCSKVPASQKMDLQRRIAKEEKKIESHPKKLDELLDKAEAIRASWYAAVAEIDGHRASLQSAVESKTALEAQLAKLEEDLKADEPSKDSQSGGMGAGGASVATADAQPVAAGIRLLDAIVMAVQSATGTGQHGQLHQLLEPILSAHSGIQAPSSTTTEEAKKTDGGTTSDVKEVAVPEPEPQSSETMAVDLVPPDASNDVDSTQRDNQDARLHQLRLGAEASAIRAELDRKAKETEALERMAKENTQKSKDAAEAARLPLCETLRQQLRTQQPVGRIRTRSEPRHEPRHRSRSGSRRRKPTASSAANMGNA